MGTSLFLVDTDQSILFVDAFIGL